MQRQRQSQVFSAAAGVHCVDLFNQVVDDDRFFLVKKFLFHSPKYNTPNSVNRRGVVSLTQISIFILLMESAASVPVNILISFTQIKNSLKLMTVVATM